jgi:hypothetical protein
MPRPSAVRAETPFARLLATSRSRAPDYSRIVIGDEGVERELSTYNEEAAEKDRAHDRPEEVPAKPTANTAPAPIKYAKIKMKTGRRIFRSMNCVQKMLPKIPDRLKMIVPIIAS